MGKQVKIGDIVIISNSKSAYFEKLAEVYGVPTQFGRKEYLLLVDGWHRPMKFMDNEFRS